MILICLVLLALFMGIGFIVTGALLAVWFWFFIKLPIAVILWGLGIVCFCTFILIPVGIGCFRAGLRLMIPGSI